MKISEFLKYGKENVISMAELSRITGLEERQLRRQIAKERKEGTLICSSTASKGGGYYLAATNEEIEHFYKAAKARALSSLRSAEPFREQLNETEGQLSITGTEYGAKEEI